MCGNIHPYYCLLSVRADGYNRDRSLKLSLKEFDIVFELLWELVLACESCHIRLPSLKLFVYRLYTVFYAEWEVACLHTVHLVC